MRAGHPGTPSAPDPPPSASWLNQLFKYICPPQTSAAGALPVSLIVPRSGWSGAASRPTLSLQPIVSS